MPYLHVSNLVQLLVSLSALRVAPGWLEAVWKRTATWSSVWQDSGTQWMCAPMSGTPGTQEWCAGSLDILLVIITIIMSYGVSMRFLYITPGPYRIVWFLSACAYLKNSKKYAPKSQVR